MIKILLVDDNQSKRNVIKRILREVFSGQHEVLEAEDGIPALDLLRENSDIAFVVGDKNMPGMGGFVLLREMREAGFNQPFILDTGDDRPSHVGAGTKCYQEPERPYHIFAAHFGDDPNWQTEMPDSIRKAAEEWQRIQASKLEGEGWGDEVRKDSQKSGEEWSL